MPNGKPEPMEPEQPKRMDTRTKTLQQLYHTIGQLLALESASISSKLVVDGDLEIPFPENVKLQVKERIVTKTSQAIGLLQDLQNG